MRSRWELLVTLAALFVACGPPASSPPASTPHDAATSEAGRKPGPAIEKSAPDGGIPRTSVMGVSTAPTIKIATFNIQVFGKTKAHRPEVMSQLAAIVREYDVIAIQEIK